MVLDQFNNEDNMNAHYETTGPEIWSDTNGTITHFVSAVRIIAKYVTYKR